MQLDQASRRAHLSVEANVLLAVGDLAADELAGGDEVEGVLGSSLVYENGPRGPL